MDSKSSSRPGAVEPHVLVLCVDTTVTAWVKRERQQEGKADQSTAVTFTEFLEHLVVFINGYLLTGSDNYLIVFGYNEVECRIIYKSRQQESSLEPPGTASSSHVSQSRRLEAVQRSVTGLKAMVEEYVQEHSALETTDKVRTHSALPGALTKGLGHINRLQNESPSSFSSEIVVLQQAPDFSANYIQVMNAIFSAQKREIPVHACVLGSKDSVFMQQAAHLTNGMYSRPEEQQHLSQFLLGLYCIEPTTRSLMQLPKQESIDLRATCFCHKRPVDSGYVCSVCLSIFCDKRPECSTCGAEFPQKRAVISKRNHPAPTPV